MAISIDFETFYAQGKHKYSVRTMHPEEYCNDERFDAYMVSVSDSKMSWNGHPRDLNWAALDGQELVSHNAGFDRAVYRRLVQLDKAPRLTTPAWHCSANMTAYLCNRRALDDAIFHLYKTRLDKSVRANANNKKWPDGFSETERVAMLRYAKDDAVWCARLWHDYSSKWPAIEQQLSDLTIRQGERGVQINTWLLDEYIIQSHEARAKIEELIPWIKDSDDESWDDFNTKPTSTKCIAEQCRRVGIPCAPVKSDDEEAYDAWVVQHQKQHPWIKALEAWRSINKLYQTFLKMKGRLRPDGTMPIGLLYFGAHTGRWSGAAQINFQNMRKYPVFIRQDFMVELDDRLIFAAVQMKDETGKYPEWVKHAIDFRALICPRPGKKMILCDLAQIEPRVLAWLCGNIGLLEKIRGGMSIYEAFARENMGYTGPKMSKASPEYKLIKIQVLQLGYGCGWEKFITTALKEYDTDLTANDPEWIDEVDPFTEEVTCVPGYGSFAKQVVREFREKNKAITRLWETLDTKFKMKIGSDFVMELPSGREMRYEHVRGEARIVKGKDGKPMRKVEFTANAGEKRRAFYGGKLCENLVQAVARDVFASHIATMDRAGLDILFTSHDEAIMEVDPAVSPKDIEAFMSVTPEWMKGCPIAAEAQEVEHYKK